MAPQVRQGSARSGPAVVFDPKLLNEAVAFVLARAESPLSDTLTANHPHLSGEAIEAIESEVTSAIDLARETIDAICVGHHARDCERPSREQVRELFPWLDGDNLTKLVTTTIAQFFR